MTARYRHPTAAIAITARRGRTAALLGTAIAIAALALGGCGSSDTSTGSAGGSGSPTLPPPLPHPANVTLILDFTPNAVHAGIYRALAAGYYRRERIDLHVEAPSATVEPLSLVAAGRAQFGLADGSDVATAIAHGAAEEAVMAIVQRPVGGLIALASEHLRSAAQLQGRTVGITGVPSDLAVLRTEVRHAGGDPARVHVATVGFNGAQALLAGRVAAFTGFVPDDGVGLEVEGHPITPFWLYRNGGPPYPGLVAFTNRALARSEPSLVRDFTAATVRGYEDTLHNPKRSLGELLAANPALPRALTAASLRAYLPLFATPGVALGTIQPAHVAALSRWMLANQLISAPIPFARYGSDAFLPGGGG
ncbi:MAG TPA: ABC transporter substrate-binding protein [Solirubrobacteraceae bacterium]|jgi:putative hydroxymethylpyrimidine transport system substrate-binding protein|nr:ABC transporter substrate-binding protein [Solirubrobacteraceae bacterium]